MRGTAPLIHRPDGRSPFPPPAVAGGGKALSIPLDYYAQHNNIGIGIGIVWVVQLAPILLHYECDAEGEIDTDADSETLPTIPTEQSHHLYFFKNPPCSIFSPTAPPGCVAAKDSKLYPLSTRMVSQMASATAALASELAVATIQ